MQQGNITIQSQKERRFNINQTVDGEMGSITTFYCLSLPKFSQFVICIKTKAVIVNIRILRDISSLI